MAVRVGASISSEVMQVCASPDAEANKVMTASTLMNRKLRSAFIAHPIRGTWAAQFKTR
jgi:hypothetical protein